MEFQSKSSSCALEILALPVKARYPAGLDGFTILAYAIGKEELEYSNDNAQPFARLNKLPSTFIVKDPPFS